MTRDSKTANDATRDSFNPVPDVLTVDLQRMMMGDLDAELTLVRAAVEHPRMVARVIEMIRPEEFTDGVCSKIWGVAQHLHRSKQPIDLARVIERLRPEDVLGDDGCASETTVADCVKATLSEGVGTADEARWCALRIRTDTYRRALLRTLARCYQAARGHQSQQAKDLLAEGSRLARAYHKAQAKDERELELLRQRLLRAR